MRHRLLIAAVALTAAAMTGGLIQAGTAAASSRNLCENDATFRYDAARGLGAAGGFASAVQQGIYWTQRKDYDYVWKLYWPGAWPNARAGKQPPPTSPLTLGTPCSVSFIAARQHAFKAWSHFADFNRLFALFPSTHGASRAQWLAVIRQGRLSDLEWAKLAAAIGAPADTVQADLVQLAVIAKSPFPK